MQVPRFALFEKWVFSLRSPRSLVGRDLSFRHIAVPLHLTLQAATVSRTLKIKPSMPVAATRPAIAFHEAGGIFRSPGQRKLVLG